MPNAGVAIPAISTVAGGILGKKSSNQAAGQQAAATEAGIAEERRQYDINRTDLTPFRVNGTNASNRLADLLGLPSSSNTDAINSAQSEFDAAQRSFNDAQSQSQSTQQPVGFNSELSWLGLGGPPIGLGGPYNRVQSGSSFDLSPYQSRLDAARAALTSARNAPTVNSPDHGSLSRNFSQSDLNADPVYQNGLQFGLDQGTGAINARARAMGNFDSGSTLKELTRYGNDYGTTKANDSFNRFNFNRTNQYNQLAGVAGSGQQAVNSGVSAGSSSANNIATLMGQGGVARSAGTIGGANAISKTLGDLGNINWSGNNSNYGTAGNYNPSWGITV